MATSKEFTGWISVEGGLINLQHARRIALLEAGNTFLVVAYLDDNDQVTLAATDKREVAEKALRYLAANVKAIYSVRQ